MTYLAFLAVFILPPIIILWVLQRGRLGRVHSKAGFLLLAIATIALVYTTPWDNYLVWRAVWSYGADRVVGTIGYVPMEEYLFFILQPIMSGLWLYWLLPASPAPRKPAVRWIGAATYTVAAASGILLLRGPTGTYLGLILAWAAPVLALQWAYAGAEIWARRRSWALGVALPTVYLWAADSIAIGAGIWSIADDYTLGLSLGTLPLEEAVFFLVTNLLVVQGLMLFLFPPQGRSPALRDHSVTLEADA